ncbi:hypothetical protein A9Q98_08550 [Thalassotalea sp. 42_200_T64]|nr:hypothetical protein A9Q98_08550 [Thalassotalea sp. 42_200_T64]
MTKSSKERRKSAASLVTTQKRRLPFYKKFALQSFGFQLSDVLTNENYSADFIDTRADFILGRLRVMALLFAVFVPLSFVFDLVFLEAKQYQPLLVARLLLAISLFTFVCFCKRNNIRLATTWLLPLAFLLPTLFYVASEVIIHHGTNQEFLAGYDLMPYLIVAMLALFPLTISRSVMVLTLVFIPCLLLKIYTGEVFTLAALNQFWAFSMFSGITIWLQTGQLTMLLKLYRESTIDPLTGLINRRVLVKRLEKEKQQGNLFSLMIFDLDKFKRINDDYGHLTGDLVLASIAKVLTAQLRDDDIIARFGGEEFVAVLANQTASEAFHVAERIRKACENTVIRDKDDNIIKVTTSVGLTQYVTGEDIDSTLNRADELLYKAKSSGRNKVVCQ